jgi:tetratricopeptide (TPR) repeat protein
MPILPRSPLKKILMILTALSLVACHSSENKSKAPLFENIGNFHHPISTQVPLAQRYFDQGLALFYSFEYGEAIRSFRAAVDADPNCAMCYWGLALALGSKTDTPLNGNELEEAKAIIQLATQHTTPLNPDERFYVAALGQRYALMSPQKMEEFAGLCSSFSLVSGNSAKNYAQAMQNLVALFPNDVDAKVLYAAALFDVAQWNFWDHQHQSMSPYNVTIQKTLESAIASDQNHPGANHLYVHFIESSPYPERALVNAERLNSLVPVSEHIAHMPCHTYFSLGRYHDATVINQHAIQIYQNYAKACKVQGFEPEVQYLYYHDIDYLISMANMEGREALALSSAKDLETQIAPLADKNVYLQKALTPTILMLARFGEWDKIRQVPKPAAQFQYALGIWHYARGLADVNFNQMDAANSELDQLKKIIQAGPIDKNMGKFGYDLLMVSLNVLQGVMANKSGQTDAMIQYFKTAIALQDKIYAADPPPWYFPVRELLGAAFLQHARPADAKLLFQQDLAMNPHNGWALYGLAQSELALGDKQAAKKAEQEFQSAWQYADIKKPIYPLF